MLFSVSFLDNDFFLNSMVESFCCLWISVCRFLDCVYNLCADFQTGRQAASSYSYTLSGASDAVLGIFLTFDESAGFMEDWL